VKCLIELDVVVLAGGLGTRLHPVLKDLPKVMAPVNGRPFLDYLLEQVRSSGARRVVLALGHLSGAVQDYIATRERDGLDIVLHIESEPRGTGGGLREVLHLTESETVLGMNGDAFTRADLGQFLDFHRARKAAISLLLTHVPNVGRYGLVDADDDGLVRSFDEKPESSESGGYINAGVYLFERLAIEPIPVGRPVSLETEVFPQACGRGLYAMKGDFPFIDIGTPEAYESAARFFGGGSDDH
jgi:NDP-sugar pyrophosphorylase family protein